MKIAISGATGFIGTHLTRYLSGQGHEVTGLGRKWFGRGNADHLAKLMEGMDVVINLAGAPVNHRWTTAYKQELYDSRIIPTRMLVDAINRTDRVRLFISASAVGYYPSRGCYDEYSHVKSDGFLAGLCRAWEAEPGLIRKSARLIITRFGVVLSPEGGAFLQLIRPLQSRLATVIGSGNQPFTWIALTDLIGAMGFVIDQPGWSGVFNFVTPEQTTNAAFTAALARRYHARLTVKLPTVFFRLFYGEGAVLLTEGQCVKPTRLLEKEFQFQAPTVEAFFKRI